MSEPIESMNNWLEQYNILVLLQLKIQELLKTDIPNLENKISESVRERDELIMWTFCQIKDYLEESLTTDLQSIKNKKKLIEAYDRIAAWTNDPLLTNWETHSKELRGENNE